MKNKHTYIIEMPKHIHITVSEDDYQQLKNSKNNRTWLEVLKAGAEE